MDKHEVDNLIADIRNHKVWKIEFKDLFDVLENGLMKIEQIPQTHTSIVNLNLTSDLIMQKANNHLKKFNLSIAQKNVLEALFYCNSNLTQSQLSNFIFSSKSNISTLLNRMEEKGFIKRFENKDNKREKLIKITKIGEEKLKQLFYSSIEAHNILETLITEKEAKELNRILFKLKRGFENLE